MSTPLAGLSAPQSTEVFYLLGKGVFFCLPFRLPLILQGGLYLDNLCGRVSGRSGGPGRGRDLSAAVIASFSLAPLGPPPCLSSCLLWARWPAPISVAPGTRGHPSGPLHRKPLTFSCHSVRQEADCCFQGMVCF